MDIERMHSIMEILSEYALQEFDKDIEYISTGEMSAVTDMMKDLSEAMYYRTVTDAMGSTCDGKVKELMGLLDDMTKNLAEWSAGMSTDDKKFLKQSVHTIEQAL